MRAFIFFLLLRRLSLKGGRKKVTVVQRAGIQQQTTGRKQGQLEWEQEGPGDYIPQNEVHPSVSCRHHLKVCLQGADTGFHLGSGDRGAVVSHFEPPGPHEWGRSNSAHAAGLWGGWNSVACVETPRMVLVRIGAWKGDSSPLNLQALASFTPAFCSPLRTKHLTQASRGSGAGDAEGTLRLTARIGSSRFQLLRTLRHFPCIGNKARSEISTKNWKVKATSSVSSFPLLFLSQFL